ncbi:MAG: FixH family protein [Nitrospirae bacterium]|nr:FixH family protein [Nitrospirota bacterium]
MKKVLFAVLAVVLAFGVAVAKDYEVKKKAGDFDVEVRIDKNPPVVGDNNFTIAVRDAAGKDITDAKVVIDYSMPAMPGMPAMNYKTDAMIKGNLYKGTMNLSMSGPWNIAVKITKAGKTSTAKFTVDAK